ncbi:MAG: 50S ribosomal protein L23 [Candidatus Omnitrophica bacterium CG11_big_fil_rev_8_21_14_0_20_63_9]|nr:MAG: 50S ribosomal protein L23 [Candidatus Omnitrophica bacterium CG11_big_fil_rev_8_21_14_0_20_63_9]
MRTATEIVKRVLQTEKAARLASRDQYLLSVARDANKIEIQQAVEELFKVKVTSVNTQNCHGKWRRLSVRRGQRPDWKKAFVTLEKGQKIEVAK